MHDLHLTSITYYPPAMYQNVTGLPYTPLNIARIITKVSIFFLSKRRVEETPYPISNRLNKKEKILQRKLGGHQPDPVYHTKM
jgi:hypothetical protein